MLLGIARLAPFVALAAVCVVGGLLSIRTLIGEDLGCHLLYGREFLHHGRIVDHNEDILYTLPLPGTPPDQLPKPMAGAWYDDQGRLRFPNANWLTQALFAAVYEIGGFAALNVFLTLCICTFLGGLLLLLRRLGMGWLPTACAVLLIALIAYERFALRPELLGYVVLVFQLVLLAPLAIDPGGRKLRWPTMAGLIGLQWVLTNVHSYFYVGWGLTAAVCVAVIVQTWRRRSDPSATQDDALLTNRRRLSLLTGLQVAVCFANPWTWRLVALPAQTALYLSKHHVSAGPGEHPWSWLWETNRTFLRWSDVGDSWRSFLADGFHGDPMRALLTIVLVLALLGALAACIQRRWALLLWILAGAYLSLSMQRNMALGVLLMVPASAAALSGAVRRAWSFLSDSSRVIGVGAVTIILLVVCGVLSAAIIDNGLYPPRYQASFGYRQSRTVLPTHLADWFNEHPLQGNIWVDFTTSSNLYFLLDPKPLFPILTNGWAYPPAVMGQARTSYETLDALNAATAEHDISAVVIRADRRAPVLGHLLWDKKDWALVFLGGTHLVYLRLDGPDADLARTQRLTPSTWDAHAFVAEAKQHEARPAHAMFATGRMLAMLGNVAKGGDAAWNNSAIVVLSAVVDLQDDLAPAWYALGSAHANRAVARRAAGSKAYWRDVEQADNAYRKVLAIHDDPNAKALLAKLRQQFKYTSAAQLRDRAK